MYDSAYHSAFPNWMKPKNRNSSKHSINSFNSQLLSASYVPGAGLEDYLVFKTNGVSRRQLGIFIREAVGPQSAEPPNCPDPALSSWSLLGEAGYRHSYSQECGLYYDSQPESVLPYTNHMTLKKQPTLPLPTLGFSICKMGTHKVIVGIKWDNGDETLNPLSWKDSICLTNFSFCHYY